MVWRDSEAETVIELPRHKPPQSGPAGYITLALCIPSDPRYIQAVVDVLDLLNWEAMWDESEYWAGQSTLRAYDAAAAMNRMNIGIQNSEWGQSCP